MTGGASLARICGMASTLRPRGIESRVVAAVVNTSPDVVELLREAFEQAGMTTVSAFTFDIRDGRVDLDGFIHQYDPRVIVYDVAPPYEANWRLFQQISSRPVMSGRAFVLTATNAAHVQKLAGSQWPIYEVVGKPFDLEQVTRAVKEASRSRPTA
jgi:DNA-binding response OmpR family regulator